MSDNLGSQLGGRLLALPSEVRLLIYRTIFPPSRNNLYDTPGPFGKGNNNRTPALLSTCRTIYTDAKAVLYENTKFHVDLVCDPL